MKLEDVVKASADLKAIKVVCGHLKKHGNERDMEMFADWEVMIENALDVIKKQSMEIRKLKLELVND